MGSRLRENPDRPFNWFLQLSSPIARDMNPEVLFQFPEDYSDEDSLHALPRFCFPYDITGRREGGVVQHFTFVLTDLEGCQRFGFCRLTNSSQTCLCVLSYLPWFEVFYKLLNNLADYLAKGQTNETRELLTALYNQPMPLAVGSVTLQMVSYFVAPDPKGLPSIPESRNLTELVLAVDVGNLLHLYASMLFERRIILLSSKLSTLTACVHGLACVLYPMHWQHIFIPVLPPHLLDYCSAPMPYLIGVHSSLFERVREVLDDVVILNVSSNSLDTPFNDLQKIPSDVVSGLKLCLKRQASSPGCGVAKAFLRGQALLFGGYRDALRQTGGQLVFDEDVFLDHKSPSMRPFLQSAVHLQFFKQFIEGRLELLNQGQEPDDLFEQEILQCDTLAGSTKAQLLVGNLKKGGGALILNVKSKAHMYKTAKDFTKSGLKKLLKHKDHGESYTLQRGNNLSERTRFRQIQSDCLQNRLPITQHFGQSRPRRPQRHGGAQKESEEDRFKEDEEEEAEEEGRGELLLGDPEEMDLLGEIFDTLSSRSVQERGLLYGTRSLDLLGPHRHNYIRQSLTNPSQDSLASWNLEEGPGEESQLFECSYWSSQIPVLSGAGAAISSQFQSHTSRLNLQNKAQTRGLPEPNTPSNKPLSLATMQVGSPQDSNSQVLLDDSITSQSAVVSPSLDKPISISAEQEVPIPIKVSELKKRFEA